MTIRPTESEPVPIASACAPMQGRLTTRCPKPYTVPLRSNPRILLTVTPAADWDPTLEKTP